MFTIIYSNKEYFHKNGKIILFESIEEAKEFLTFFINYSIQRLTQEGRIHEEIITLKMISQNSKIVPVDFDINTIECGTILCKELKG